MLQELENYLVDKIAIALSGVNVSAWPDDPDESPAAKTSTNVFVAYSSGSFKQSARTTYALSVEATLSFEVTIEAQGLHTHQRVLQVLDSTREALLGLRMPLNNSEPLMIASEKFVDVVDRMWIYRQIYEVETKIEQGESPLSVATAEEAREAEQRSERFKALENNITIRSGLYRTLVPEYPGRPVFKEGQDSFFYKQIDITTDAED
mgnify:CR=1 FL=1